MSCPTPTKTAFTSERAAKRGLRALRNPLGEMHAYRCGTHWHLGHNDRVDRGRHQHPASPRKAAR